MRDVATLQDVDFLDYAGFLTSLNDVFFSADVLYCVCADQARERELDEADFGRALKGSCLFEAIAVLTAEYIDFFPNPTTTAKMRTLVEKQRDAQALLCDAILAKTDDVLTKILADAGTSFGVPSSEPSPSREEITEVLPSLPSPTSLQSQKKRGSKIGTKSRSPRSTRSTRTRT